MTPEQATTITEFLLPQIEQEIETTAKVIAAVPDQHKDYTPHEKCMKAGELAEHLLGADIWFLEAIVNSDFGAYPEPTNQPTSELAERYTARTSELLKEIKGLSGDHMAKEVSFHGWTLPNVSFLQVMQKHSVHHRGQLTAYLRPMGAKVPSIYGGSADEPMAAAAEGN